MSDSTPRRLAAIVSTDVVGYTRLMGADETGTLRVLQAHREELIDPIIAGHGGRIVKTMGDGRLLEFPSVVEAVRCVLEVQEGMAARNADVAEDRRIVFRIGVNLGDIIIDGEDILGDGVNVATRLQELAEPGGIVLSTNVHEQIRDRLDTAFADHGLHEVKNVARPIQVWRWRPDRAATPVREEAGKTDVKPSIAVLPFDNMSRDPDQEFFVDGMTEDIITELSRNRWMTVIARNTTFTYKGAAVNIADVARELGVRYVLEGSVRKAADRVRISVQLIEGATGNHLWAERFDRQIIDIFDLQDDVTRAIAAAIEPEIFAIEGHNASKRDAADLSVWEDMMRARANIWRMTQPDSEMAIERLNELLARHPDNPLANSLLAFVYLFSIHMGWVPPEPYRANANSHARKALSLDEQDTWAHIALGYSKMMERDTDAAVRELSRAIDLNPNSATAYGYRALANAFGGRIEEGQEDFAQANKLSPRDPQLAYFMGASVVSNFIGGNFELSIRIADQSLEMRPEFIGAMRIKCSALAHLGRIDEARKILKKVLDLQPDTSLANLEAAQPYSTAAGMGAFLGGLKLAGLH